MKTNDINVNFQESQLLSPILQKAKIIVELDHFLQTIWPSTFKDHCKLMNFTENTLVVGVTNAVWITRLRYLEDELVQKIRQHPAAKKIDRIHYRIRMELTPTTSISEPDSPKHILSSRSRQILEGLAQDLNPSELKDALTRLLNE